ncbi:MAG: hypothetical protein K8J31_14635 [Anaerolineae bacterium]|nr:hypothetical protein [Anaerolineae bacterium]
MMRKLLEIVLIVIALGSVVAVTAQEAFPERELVTVLKMGEQVFEPEIWLANGGETNTGTTASWQSTFESGFSGLSFLNYMHFDTGYTLDGLDTFFNDDWFKQTFVSWEDVRKTNVCFNGDVTLHEFSMSYRESSGNVARYVLRYWVDPISETRVRAWHVGFATTYSDGTNDPRGQELLDEYSARMYPDFASCGR